MTDHRNSKCWFKYCIMSAVLGLMVFLISDHMVDPTKGHEGMSNTIFSVTGLVGLILCAPLVVLGAFLMYVYLPYRLIKTMILWLFPTLATDQKPGTSEARRFGFWLGLAIVALVFLVPALLSASVDSFKEIIPDLFEADVSTGTAAVARKAANWMASFAAIMLALLLVSRTKGVLVLARCGLVGIAVFILLGDLMFVWAVPIASELKIRLFCYCFRYSLLPLILIATIFVYLSLSTHAKKVYSSEATTLPS